VYRSAGFDEVEKRTFLTLPELEPQLLGRPARTQTLYRLRYHGSLKRVVHIDFENRVLRRIFEPKMDDVTGDWRKLHNEELVACTPRQV
jgi:hypothetical protein